MSDFMQDALGRATAGAPGWLAGLHAAGRASWQGKRLPDRKTEAWKYTNLRALERGEYAQGLPTAAPEAQGLDAHYAIPDLDSARIVFVNGHFSEALSSAALPDGVEVVRFAAAGEEQARLIAGHLGTAVDRDRHLFAALNDLWLADGVFIRVGAGVRVARPLQVVWLTLPQSAPFSVCARLLMVVEEGGDATLVEQFVSAGGEQNSFTNGITEALVGDNAHLAHYRLHLEEEHALHIGGMHARLGRAARLDSFHLALGGTVRRVDVVVEHAGEGAECFLNGVYLPCNEQQVDYHTTIEHAVPHGTTSEVFRGIVSDSARAVFNGRIHIHKGAQKTRAELSNKNLLTSNRAEVDTKPELEIYADDVQCAHGATVAQLDEEALFYLRSRGIPRREAEVMLSFGFINELVDRLSHEPVARYLRPILVKRFTDDSRLARHIA